MLAVVEIVARATGRLIALRRIRITVHRFAVPATIQVLIGIAG
jgi:hypothetical protein